MTYTITNKTTGQVYTTRQTTWRNAEAEFLATRRQEVDATLTDGLRINTLKFEPSADGKYEVVFTDGDKIISVTPYKLTAKYYTPSASPVAKIDTLMDGGTQDSMGMLR